MFDKIAYITKIEQLTNIGRTKTKVEFFQVPTILAHLTSCFLLSEIAYITEIEQLPTM